MAEEIKAVIQCDQSKNLICWVPGRFGIFGNGKADTAGKITAVNENNPSLDRAVPYTNMFHSPVEQMALSRLRR